MPLLLSAFALPAKRSLRFSGAAVDYFSFFTVIVFWGRVLEVYSMAMLVQLLRVVVGMFGREI